ncbi:hypothetical protein GJ496_010889 [Pomphorhynchus laevis]|nr:hypothetical protein GJ496_010889 [Pomphorhynchus laevis]
MVLVRLWEQFLMLAKADTITKHSHVNDLIIRTQENATSDRVGHIANNCRATSNQSRICFVCASLGHLAHKCPKRYDVSRNEFQAI